VSALLALLLAFPAAAADTQDACSSVDLRPRLYAAGVPEARPQGESGWCYAFVAAELLSYRFGFNVSAADVALSHLALNGRMLAGRELGPFPVGGGFSSYALEAAARRGGCREDQMPLRPGPPDTASCDLTPRALALFEDPAIRERAPAVRPGFCAALNELGERGRCASPAPLPGVSVARHMRPEDGLSAEQLLAAVDQELDRRNMVALDVDSLIFLQPERARWDDNDHAVSVVGREWRDGACRYIVRNAGEDCAGFAGEAAAGCRAGTVRLSADTLRRGATRAYALR
jgi:hypothetical protein